MDLQKYKIYGILYLLYLLEPFLQIMNVDRLILINSFIN